MKRRSNYSGYQNRSFKAPAQPRLAQQPAHFAPTIPLKAVNLSSPGDTPTNGVLVQEETTSNSPALSESAERAAKSLNGLGYRLVNGMWIRAKRLNTPETAGPTVAKKKARVKTEPPADAAVRVIRLDRNPQTEEEEEEVLTYPMDCGCPTRPDCMHRFVKVAREMGLIEDEAEEEEGEVVELAPGEIPSSQFLEEYEEVSETENSGTTTPPPPSSANTQPPSSSPAPSTTHPTSDPKPSSESTSASTGATLEKEKAVASEKSAPSSDSVFGRLPSVPEVQPLCQSCHEYRVFPQQSVCAICSAWVRRRIMERLYSA